jgi:hypothetical protein
MKGIIAEIHGSYIIVIAKNGDFIKCKKLPNCNIGDEIIIPIRNMRSIYKKISTIAASFIILAMMSTGVYAYYTPYSYVSVDINPSLELSVNRFDKVIGVHAYNEEAQSLLDSSTDIKYKGIDVALAQIIDRAEDNGYIKQDAQNSVMIVVSSNSAKEEAALTKKISKTSTEAMSKISDTYEVILEKTKVENFKKSHQENISPGRVILANEFKEVKPEVNEEEIKQMPLQQAIKEIEKKADNSIKAALDNKKPKENNREKSNVMNVKELIKEKNEELGKKIEENKNKEKQIESSSDKGNDKNKDNSNDNDSNKDDDKESFNQDQEDKESSDKKDTKETRKDGQDQEKETNKDNSKDQDSKKDSKNKK